MHAALMKQFEPLQEMRYAAGVVLLCGLLETCVVIWGIRSPILGVLLAISALFAYFLCSASLLLHGIKHASLVVVSLCVPHLITSFFLDDPGALIFLLQWGLTTVGVLVLSVSLRAYKSWSLGFECVAGLAVLVVLLAHAWVPDLTQWWVDLMQLKMNPLIEDPSYQGPALQPLIQNLARFQTGYMVTHILVLASMLITWLAMNWVRAIQPTQWTQYLKGVRVGKTLTLSGLIVLISLWFQPTSITLDIVPIWMILLAFSGLSMIHILAAESSSKNIILSCVYLVIFLMPTTLLSCVILGMIDGLTPLRAWCVARLKGQTQ